MYQTKIICDSLAPCGQRLTTWELTYPRFVHAELMTHRMFSRNSASSRAIPSAKLIQRVVDDPAMPVYWGANQKGMQAAAELEGEPLLECQRVWLEARDAAVGYARRLMDLGLHKQIANRVVEPWMFITVLVTATEFDNWFRLRDHAAAQPEIAWVARDMRKKYLDGPMPQRLGVGEWHLPLIFDEDLVEARGRTPGDRDQTDVLIKVSVGRTARVSYLTHDGRRDLDEDLRLYEQLRTSGHWSPFEHAAMALDEKRRVGNFIGWHQHRADVDPHFIH